MTLAFNTIGSNSQNFLFNTLDTLIGGPVIAGLFNADNPATAQDRQRREMTQRRRRHHDHRSFEEFFEQSLEFGVERSGDVRA